jgi:hypothetical protein
MTTSHQRRAAPSPCATGIAATSPADVDTAKPKPDIIHVALRRAGVSAERTVFVGDAIWDAEACARAQVTSVGVLSGGVSRTELENARAAMVFANAEDLLRHIEETPIAWLATHRILLIRTEWAQSELGLGPSLLTSY